MLDDHWQENDPRKRGSFVVGISGKIGAGKDAIASYLARRYEFKVIRFSDQLKEEVLKTMRMTCEEIWREYYEGTDADPTDEKLRTMLWCDKPPIVRRLLQEWGTELRRHEDPDYWVKKWSVVANQALNDGYSVVAPDQRFMNEIQAVQSIEPSRGYSVLVERPGTAEGDHASEHEWTAYAGWKWTFHNDGALEALYSKVDEFMDHLLGGHRK